MSSQAADQGQTIRVRVTATNGVLPNGTATSAATAVVVAPTPATPTGDSGGNAAPIPRPSVGTPRLSVAILPSRSRVESGQSMRIGLRTRNVGTGTGTGTRVVSCIRLPSNMALVHAGSAARSGRTLCFGLGDLPAGAQRTRAITVRAVAVRNATGSITGTARGWGEARVTAPVRTVIIRPRAERARVTG